MRVAGIMEIKANSAFKPSLAEVGNYDNQVSYFPLKLLLTSVTLLIGHLTA